ncbi:SRPBCC family protein [Rhodovulum euryhalinum]|uniref:Polyketide cyclase/dehydrase/lipid transport protein n=1 Tax=Rhodovulum euryhalinum TaxID=35805 RepID=A0A4R2KPG6_9RHOB|nr:SRPBCC family protein [Rhodovulum euryhalinum]TCO71958.1 polyketide cyclase/dehydrase/lipid transport protein [Rhodovulum euryhalinum]
MKFSTREDIGLPIEEVFAVISDFDRLERAAMRRGAEITRLDSLEAPGPGMAWTARFTFRGKRRALHSELTTFLPPENLVVQSTVNDLTGVSTLDLLRLAPQRTRLAVAVDLRPQSFQARLLLQTLHLAKGRMSERFKSGVARFARELEAGTFHGTDF